MLHHKRKTVTISCHILNCCSKLPHNLQKAYCSCACTRPNPYTEALYAFQLTLQELRGEMISSQAYEIESPSKHIQNKKRNNEDPNAKHEITFFQHLVGLCQTKDSTEEGKAE
eukprot:c23886_g3_i1 orf=701-1039(+)